MILQVKCSTDLLICQYFGVDRNIFGDYIQIYPPDFVHRDYTKASPFGRGGGEADGEGDEAQTHTAILTSTDKTNTKLVGEGLAPPVLTITANLTLTIQGNAETKPSPAGEGGSCSACGTLVD
jgi:hypothetical protein